LSEGATGQQEIPPGLKKTGPEPLLEAANRASERVAGVHLAFMAVCVYVLAIVFGTTDLDLLLGKGVRLPVVNVDVPLVGFYAFAPFIVVLVHFNLLLQLQLLSRKLFAFEAAAPPEAGPGGLRDRLHIFPYTYYLVGRPSPLVQPLLGLMVSITLVLLPLVTLLVLQLWFLAYQGEAVTWGQRGAIWLDIAMIVILWPLILDPQDDWGGYWGELMAEQGPWRWAWLPFALLLGGFVLLLFSAKWTDYFRVGLVLLLVSALVMMLLRGWQPSPRFLKASAACLMAAVLLAVAIYLSGQKPQLQLFFLPGPLLLLLLAVLWQPKAPRGSLALLITLWLGLLLPLAFQVNGGGLERLVVRLQPGPTTPFAATMFSEVFLQDYRRLSLNEQVLLKTPPKPETLALIRSGHWQEGLKQIEPLNLRGRHLRQAKMARVILLGADLRGAQLQGANLVGAQLQGANLEEAELQGADLLGAQLQGADLFKAQLQGADLREANLYGVEGDLSKEELIDARGIVWEPLPVDKSWALGQALSTWIKDEGALLETLQRLGAASHPDAPQLRLQSCLARPDTPLVCDKRYDPEKPEALAAFKRELHEKLSKLACESPWIAQGLIEQIKEAKSLEEDSSRQGLAEVLKNLLNKKECRGLQGLSQEWKDELKAIK
jgi:hypothetical protein